jgi:thiosulfate dehydrogenase [quinone] large subunit
VIDNLTINTDRSLGYALLRLVLGINIAIHGISRILSGASAFAESLVPQFTKTPLPPWSVYSFGIALPWAEALVGLLLLVGFASRYTYIAGALMIAALTFGSALRQDWQAVGLQLIYSVVYSILLAFREYNRFSIDEYRN